MLRNVHSNELGKKHPLQINLSVCILATVRARARPRALAPRAVQAPGPTPDRGTCFLPAEQLQEGGQD